MNTRQRLLQNISCIAGNARIKQQQNQSNVRIRSQKSRKENASFIVTKLTQQPKTNINLYQTQIHSPIKNRSMNQNKENNINNAYVAIKNSDELIINSAESHSLNLSYSPSSKKKPQPSCFVLPSRSIKPKLKLTRKTLEIRNIYLDKPKQNNFINIKCTQKMIR
ncbi:unnamed protein product (macronuclear) [Paramecium tetraurelia]|uniref:Uncharacterized protein n=1 Tax=Paramecium tetraurelia TaxID=5888 RepID=A0BME2_PARTE|nr:uncharacterized protein GSPATT00030345001 [Paramecium tetraurelia]CAK59709.1 unnamed protein product [Paramecium tetraurelia]|eukprot:XP_001427107.1 hypothetical protein (macronuclear) [Paramecium tetraurelia strain d4-2]